MVLLPITLLWVIHQFIMDWCDIFSRISHGCCIDTRTLVSLLQCQWSNSGDNGEIVPYQCTTKHSKRDPNRWFHYGDVIMGAIASQITSRTIVYSTAYSDADQRKQQSSASLAFVRGIHRGPVNSPHKWPVTRKMFPFDDVIMRGMYCTYIYALSRTFIHFVIFSSMICNNTYID